MNSNLTSEWTQVEVEFGSLEMQDLFEPTNDLLLCIKNRASSRKVSVV